MSMEVRFPISLAREGHPKIVLRTEMTELAN
jgi:hypothetical protein